MAVAVNLSAYRLWAFGLDDSRSALGEIVRRLGHDPAYLQQNDMELVAADGRVLPTTGALDAARAERRFPCFGVAAPTYAAGGG
ncbi:hypothetical protein [Massilia brevitalea]|uniref:hypothetical protein n=1 Tax=Massilia brevitalea TaxID=442526 RepID=UPI0027394DF6|nr:hypothetical protein [Massilia brevitalea]